MKMKKKKKAFVKGCIIGFTLILLSVLIMYFGLAKYYGGGFSYGTWINGVYCTGKSINEVNEELLEKCSYEGLTITMGDGKSYTILPEEVNLAYTFKEPLEKYLKIQNPYLWIDNLIGSSGEKTLLPALDYDKKTFEKKLSGFGIVEGKTDSERKVEIQKGDKGYYLVNERENVLNAAFARSLIYEAFESQKPEINLESEGCYSNLPLTKEMEDTLKLWEQLKEYQNCRIIYQFGEEQVPVDEAAASGFLMLDENGNFVFDEEGRLCTDEEKVYAFVDTLADKYDTVGGVRHFSATRGEIVTVEGGIYGNKIDREAEKEYLLQAFLDKKAEIHTPEYTQMAQKQGSDDIGDTYIEVDMTLQMMYYYVDGRLEIETPVVTGNTSLRRGTPSGTNYVYAKQRNRTLRGEGYASFVKYWIPVKGNIGIHDSSWRSEYGGEIYKKNGSHGCINTPLDEVARLYELVEVGTPCVMFY